MGEQAGMQGKGVVVTGASSGIGRAIAERFGAAGAHVVMAGRTESAMKESRQKIEDSGGSASIVTLDVRDPAAVQDLVAGAASAHGLDVMVNNAGVSHPGPIGQGTPDQWREMLEVNVLALLVGAQAAMTAMRAAGRGGHIVNISSIAAHSRESGVYGATKHAVNCITSSLRTELEDENIRVVSIMPGAVATNFARNFDPSVIQGIGAVAGVEMDWEKGDRLPDEVLEKTQAALDQSLAAPEDVADAVLYAVGAPLRLNIEELVVRPAKQLNF